MHPAAAIAMCAIAIRVVSITWVLVKNAPNRLVCRNISMSNLAYALIVVESVNAATNDSHGDYDGVVKCVV